MLEGAISEERRKHFSVILFQQKIEDGAHHATHPLTSQGSDSRKSEIRCGEG